MANVYWPTAPFTTKWPPSGFTTEWPSSSSGKTWPSVSLLPPPGAPVIWFDAQNIDGTNNSSLVDGQTIGTWKNLGSLGVTGNAVQATAGLRPFYRLVATLGKLNNKSAVESDGVRGMSGSAFSAIAQPNVVAVVFRPTSIAATGTIFDGALGSNLSVIGTTGQLQLFSGVSFGTGQFLAANTWETIVGTFNGVTSFGRFNSSQSANGNAGATSATNVGLLQLASGATVATGMMAELLMYNDGTAGAAIEAYFSAKYGATPQ